jgi:hypothetical protein
MVKAFNAERLLRSFDVQTTDANRDTAETVRKLPDKVMMPSPDGFRR